MFSWQKYQKPTIVLSPMSGYTDSAFKQIVRLCAPEAVLVTEFVSTDAVFFNSPKTLKMMEFAETEHPVILQVFGKRPERFVHAAKVAEEMGYDGVDINMGCPARKIISSEHGSALVKIENRETALKIVSEMAKAVKIPVSVKTRLGWENADDLMTFSKELESNGCASLCIHGRTTKQGYGGQADWEPIYELKRNLSIPVLGNGDISSVSTFRKKLGNLDGVFIGRASFGDPWIIGDILDYLKDIDNKIKLSDEELDQFYPRADSIPWPKRKEIILQHCELAVLSKGEQLGMLEMRKHLAVYIKGLPGARELRSKLVRVSSFGEAENIINTVSVD